MAYSAGDTLVRAVMEAASGLPEDRIVGDFSFKFSGTPGPSDYTALFDSVSRFYRDVPTGGTNAPGAYISNFISRSVTHLLQAYAITTPPLGSPIADTAWLGPPTAGDSTGLPTEVAAVLSFHADLTGIPEESGTTRPQARRRGRLFFGPLITSCVDTTVVPYRLAASFNSELRRAATDLADNAAADGWTWAVWSRADALLRPVVAGWTDNAPDTQRRRGPRASVRTVWTV